MVLALLIAALRGYPYLGYEETGYTLDQWRELPRSTKKKVYLIFIT